MISDHVENQAVFITCSGPTKTYKFLMGKTLRPSCLQVLSQLSLMPNVIEWKILEGLLRVMQVAGGEDIEEASRCLLPSVLDLRLSVTHAIRTIMLENKLAKISFLRGFGLDWLFQTITTLIAQVELRTSSSDEKESPEPLEAGLLKQVVQLIVVSLRTISVAITDHKEAREKIRFATLLKPLHATFLLNPEFGIEICDALLDMSVAKSWPFFDDLPIAHPYLVPSLLRLHIYNKASSLGPFLPLLHFDQPILVFLLLFLLLLGL